MNKETIKSGIAILFILILLLTTVAGAITYPVLTENLTDNANIIDKEYKQEITDLTELDFESKSMLVIDALVTNNTSKYGLLVTNNTSKYGLYKVADLPEWLVILIIVIIVVIVLLVASRSYWGRGWREGGSEGGFGGGSSGGGGFGGGW